MKILSQTGCSDLIDEEHAELRVEYNRLELDMLIRLGRWVRPNTGTRA